MKVIVNIKSNTEIALGSQVALMFSCMQLRAPPVDIRPAQAQPAKTGGGVMAI